MIHTLPQLSYISGESGHPIRSPLQERNVNLEKSASKQSRSPIKVTIKQNKLKIEFGFDNYRLP